jgi:UDP-N-acetylmuramoyl-L-alanyl-D-glutamate--2,6-diaminopimelate ligase
MNLGQAIKGVCTLAVNAPESLELSGCVSDSREVKPGSLYLAMLGENVDGHIFCAKAMELGAAALVVSKLAHVPAGAPYVLVEDTRRVLSIVANNIYQQPSEALTLVGITGTNGKTSVTYIAEALLGAAGMTTGVIGTVDYRFAGRNFTMPHTTPESPIFCRFLREMADSGVGVALTEVSSHALELQRVEDLQFALGVFTNLSQDHLDYHGTLEQYGAAKKRLFTRLLKESRRLQGAIINVDDALGRQLAGQLTYKVLTYGVASSDADIVAREIESTSQGVRFIAAGPWGDAEVTSRLVGMHNVLNILAALGIAELCGADVVAVAGALATLESIPGRLESVPNPLDIGIWVDYCHTPDAISQVLEALRPVVENRLIVVFGAGGDRDKDKRPLMGAAVEAGADLAVVTSDNPRTEDPLDIIDGILEGLSGGYKFRQTLVAPDRATAIETAIAISQPGDGILVGGKGHETYQLVGSETHHFDDREHAAAAVQRLVGRLS